MRSLRPSLGVRADALDAGSAGLVAGLAMAGVPLSVGTVAPDVAALLGPAVVEAITAPVDLDDPLAREEHSVVLRRAALRGVLHGGLAATARPAWPAYASRGEPSVSVVLATKRPEMLAFALRQVRKQRGVDLQLVLAPHGFTPGRRRAAGARARARRRPAAATSPCCSATCSPTPWPPPTATWC